MTPDEIMSIQKQLGLSDGKMAVALGVTRQTWRNWRRGEKCPKFAQNALKWMMELRRIAPANDNLPDRVRVMSFIIGGSGLCERVLEAILAGTAEQKSPAKAGLSAGETVGRSAAVVHFAVSAP